MARSLARLLLLLVLLLVPTSCETPPMSPELQAQHTAALDAAESARLEAEEAKLARVEAEALLASALERAAELEGELTLLEAAPGEADPAAVSSLVAELESLQDSIDLADAAKAEAEAAYEVARDEVIAQTDLATDIEERAAEETGSLVFDMLGNLFPPLQGLSDAWLLLAPLLFKRPRDRAVESIEHLGRAVASAVDLKGKSSMAELREALRQAAGVYGLKHSTEDPLQLVANAAKVAAASSGTKLEDVNAALLESYVHEVNKLGHDPAAPVVLEAPVTPVAPVPPTA